MFPKYVLLSICAFIRVHFGSSKNFHSIHPSGVYTFFPKTSYDQRMFSNKSWKLSLFTSMFFLARQLLFLFIFFFFFLLFLFLLVLFSFSSFFFFFKLFVHFFFFFSSLKDRAGGGTYYLLMSKEKRSKW